MDKENNECSLLVIYGISLKGMRGESGLFYVIMLK